MINQDKMEAAMLFLAESDLPYAQAKTSLMQTEILCKRTRARIFLSSDGSVESRKAAAETHGEAIAADDQYCEATLAFETLKARRSRAEIVVDVWRSINASQRRA
jgi:hypothetical protein